MTPIAWIGIDEAKKGRGSVQGPSFPWVRMCNAYYFNVVERCFC